MNGGIAPRILKLRPVVVFCVTVMNLWVP